VATFVIPDPDYCRVCLNDGWVHAEPWDEPRKRVPCPACNRLAPPAEVGRVVTLRQACESALAYLDKRPGAEGVCAELREALR
jgi:hypothetical protein